MGEAALNLYTASQDEKDKLDRAGCRESLGYLCVNKLGYKDFDQCHLDLLEWRQKNSGKRFRLLLLPRGHLKTSIITVGQTIQDVLRDNDISILLTSAVWGNARSFLHEIKAHLEKGELPRLFGKFVSDLWNQDKVEISQRVKPNKSPTIDTGGVDKTLTSQHYNIIRCDDLVTRENVTSPEQMEKAKNHIKDLIKLLEPDGILEVIGTRWHDGDAYGWIIDELSRPELGEDAFVVYKRQAVENGKPIFPKKFNFQVLSSIKAQIGSYEYACNYDNEPVNPDTQLFRPPVRYWDDLPSKGDAVITVDLAGAEEDSDFNVINFLLFSKANQLFDVEYRRGRFKPAQVIDHIFELADKAENLGYTPTIGVEAIAYQRVMLYLLRLEMDRRRKFLSVMPIRPHKEKEQRIRALQPLWERGDLLLKRGMVELEEEFTRFPFGKNDDVLDTVEMALHMVQGTMPEIPVLDPLAHLLSNPGSYREWQNVREKVLKRPESSPATTVMRMGR